MAIHDLGVSRRQMLGGMIGTAGVLALAACSSSGGGSKGGSGTPVKGLPAVPDSLIAAAKKEGHVSVWSSVQTGNYADFIKNDFEKAYPGVKVDLYTAQGSQRDVRFQNEFKAHVNKADVFVGGAAGPNAQEKPAGMIQPVLPFLEPSVIDTKFWLNNQLNWTDTEHQYFLSGDYTISPQVVVGKDGNVSDVTSWDDLLKPEWRGQIAMNDPRQSGIGFALAMVMYCHPDLGPNYVKELFSGAKITLSSDDRQIAQWVAQGTKKAALAPQPTQVDPLIKLGQKLTYVPILNANGKPAGGFNASAGVAFVPNNKPLPHPNAARLYLNWHYSQAGGQSLVDNIKTDSGRNDVDTSSLPKYVLPVAGVKYISANEVATPANVTKMRNLVAQSIGG